MKKRKKNKNNKSNFLVNVVEYVINNDYGQAIKDIFKGTSKNLKKFAKNRVVNQMRNTAICLFKLLHLFIKSLLYVRTFSVFK